MDDGTNRTALVIEDDEAVRTLLTRMLTRLGTSVTTAATAAEARTRLFEEPFGLVVCDIRLPDGPGLDLVPGMLRACPAASVLVVSGVDDPSVADRAMRLGAHAYLTKPFTLNQLRIAIVQAGAMRVENAERHRSLAMATRYRDDAMRSLARAVELRDPDMNGHVERIGAYSRALADAAGLDGESVGVASELHDIGKIGIRDAVLLKPGALDPEERAHIEEHAQMGYELLKDSESERMRLAALIAWTHHERVDGSGYPRGLTGDEIPIEGRLVGLVDVFDALTSDRVYRPAFPLDKVISMLMEGRGRQFDADLVDLLLDNVPTLEASCRGETEGARVAA